MAFSNYEVFIVVNGKVRRNTKNLSCSFKGMGVTSDGTDKGTNITEVSGAFDFNTKKLSNVATGTANGDAVNVGQMNTALGSYIPTSQKGAVNGVATLGADGKIPVAQIPPVALNEVHVVADNTERDALTVEEGDMAIVTSTGKTWIYDGSAWREITAAGAVISVNGQTGAVSLDADDVPEAATPTNKYFTDARAKAAVVDDAIVDSVTDKAPSQNAVFDALALKSDTTHNHDADYADIDHNHTGIYSPVGHIHTISDITDLSTTLSTKQDYSDRYKSFTNNQGGSITIRQFVLQSAAGQVQLLRANDAVGEGTLIGCVQASSIADTEAGNIYLPSMGTRIGGFTGLDTTKLVYASRTTDGGYIQDLTGFVTGEKVIILGKPISATEIIFIGEYDYEIGD